MKVKKPVLLFFSGILSILCLIWVVLHISVYMPGATMAEVVYADANGRDGYDSLKYIDKDGNRINFHYEYNGESSSYKSGDVVIIGGEVISYNDDYTGEINGKLSRVHLWKALLFPCALLVLIFIFLFCLIKYIRQKRIINNIVMPKAETQLQKKAEEIKLLYESGDNVLVEKHAYAVITKLIGDGQCAWKQCVKIYENYVVFMKGKEFSNSAQLEEYDRQNNYKTKYIEKVYIPFSNVDNIVFDNAYTQKICFKGHCFLCEKEGIRSWTNSLEITTIHMEHEELCRVLDEKTTAKTAGKLYREIKEIQGKTGNGLAKVEFGEEKFVGSDYGIKKERPTLYFINNTNITDLVYGNRVITLPYGMYEIWVYGWRLRQVGDTGRASEGYCKSNVVQVMLNENYSKVKISVERAINSAEGRHIDVK